MADPETIYHWRRLDDRITTSGQPTEAQLAELQALGVRHVVNLGLHTHVSRLGMDATQARAEMEAIWHPEGIWAAFVDG